MYELIIAIACQIMAIIALFIYVDRRYLPNLIQNVIDDVSEEFKSTFAEPNVKKAFSILGKQSGDARSVRAVQDNIATNVIDQQLGGLKMIAGQLGFDVDEMIEQYGATSVLQGIQQFLPMVKGFLPKSLKKDLTDTIP